MDNFNTLSLSLTSIGPLDLSAAYSPSELQDVDNDFSMMSLPTLASSTSSELSQADDPSIVPVDAERATQGTYGAFCVIA
ncbi:hypothetical protein K435DRAFT_784038 [Dendrothele bispora CBS 962.96]|uniref:Pheromone n=1 Tax=Dendrothele bispora (strain CBS 962.96) TaxID=1314807 RepID=A0A4S8L5I0_DENBC|nr:hypothetical protein K435DRAFT_784038 [Dendrothele bispora CBS 962.96]